MTHDSKTASTGKITFEEFLVAYPDSWAEWVDGEVVLMAAAANRDHDDFGGFFYTLLRHFAEHRGGRALSEPFVMKTGPDLPGRSPDAAYVAEGHLDRLRKNYLDGPADLVVEVISPESKKRDREEKLGEFEKGGVREYWIVDPDTREAEFFVLRDDNRYHRADLGAEGVFRSTVLEGAWIRRAWLEAERLPPVLEVLAEWGWV